MAWTFSKGKNDSSVTAKLRKLTDKELDLIVGGDIDMHHPRESNGRNRER